MGLRRGLALVGAFLLTLSFGPLTVLCAAQTHPASVRSNPVGTPVTTIIEFGDQYLGGDELYDAKITVLEVVRGEKAWSKVKQADAANPAPKAGFEYVVARVRFEFLARTAPSHYSYNLDPTQFVATGVQGQELDAPILAEAVKPSLRGTLKPGDSVEGWLMFVVPHGMTKPEMIFRENVGTVSHRGGGTWFDLYARVAKAR